MPAVPRIEKKSLLSARLVRRAYLFAVWFWLFVCLLFPTWVGRSYLYDPGSGQWQTSGAFGITGSGNPMTSQAPIWDPPQSSGGLPTAVRWPPAQIEAEHNIEIQFAATFWRFTSGLFFAGLVVSVLRWTKCVRDPDRVLLVASAITVTILTANIALIGIGAASMGFALIDPVVIGVLSVAIALGISVGGFVLRLGHGSTPPQQSTAEAESSSPAPAADTDCQQPSREFNLTSMKSLNWWWRVPAYLAFQLFVWALVASQSWPVGRDVFGPYQLEPDLVVKAYWLQFILLPFCSRRFQVFGLIQLLVIVLIYVLPGWPLGGNVFAPFIRVPAGVWPLFWIQFVATLVLFWRAPYLAKQFSSWRSQR